MKFDNQEVTYWTQDWRMFLLGFQIELRLEVPFNRATDLRDKELIIQRKCWLFWCYWNTQLSCSLFNYQFNENPVISRSFLLGQAQMHQGAEGDNVSPKQMLLQHSASWSYLSRRWTRFTSKFQFSWDLWDFRKGRQRFFGSYWSCWGDCGCSTWGPREWAERD